MDPPPLSEAVGAADTPAPSANAPTHKRSGSANAAAKKKSGGGKRKKSAGSSKGGKSATRRSSDASASSGTGAEDTIGGDAYLAGSLQPHLAVCTAAARSRRWTSSELSRTPQLTRRSSGLLVWC